MDKSLTWQKPFGWGRKRWIHFWYFITEEIQDKVKDTWQTSDKHLTSDIWQTSDKHLIEKIAGKNEIRWLIATLCEIGSMCEIFWWRNFFSFAKLVVPKCPIFAQGNICISCISIDLEMACQRQNLPFYWVKLYFQKDEISEKDICWISYCLRSHFTKVHKNTKSLWSFIKEFCYFGRGRRRVGQVHIVDWECTSAPAALPHTSVTAARSD